MPSEPSSWLELPIRCPHCGNQGQPDGAWEAHGCTPFKLVEEVVRSWEFMARQAGDGLLFTADASNESVDWESGTNLRIECMQCFESFAIPEGTEILFVD